MTVFALDVSNVAPITEPLAAQAQKQGVRVLIAKATEGGSFDDHTLATHRQIAANVGMRFGTYLFLHALSAGDEADAFIGYAKPRPGELVAVDVEAGGLDGGNVARIAARAEACTRALEQHGLRPVMYCSSSWWPDLVAAAPGLRRLRVWEAQYPGAFTRWVPSVGRLRARLGRGATVVMWQWTDRFQVGAHSYDCSRVFVPVDSL